LFFFAFFFFFFFFRCRFFFFFFFFFQAEDGIRDRDVTGVQTCALPISTIAEPLKPHPMNDWLAKHEFERFGCTPCHGGDGSATTLAGAHQGGRGWDDPMLSRALA